MWLKRIGSDGVSLTSTLLSVTSFVVPHRCHLWLWHRWHSFTGRTHYLSFANLYTMIVDTQHLGIQAWWVVGFLWYCWSTLILKYAPFSSFLLCVHILSCSGRFVCWVFVECWICWVMLLVLFCSLVIGWSSVFCLILF